MLINMFILVTAKQILIDELIFRKGYIKLSQFCFIKRVLFIMAVRRCSGGPHTLYIHKPNATSLA